MRCKKCDYRLWNLTERRCPECGTPFRPGEFEFVPNSVQFCCPHCGQAYYGTTAKGHLEPPAFMCVRCGAAIQMDDMVLLPTSGVDEEQTKVAGIPWLQRGTRGPLRAWLATVGAALVAPGRLMLALPENASPWPARGFAALTLFVTAAVAIGPFALLPWLVSSAMGPPVPHVLWGMTVAIGVAFGLLALATVLWGLAAHGLLRITGRTAGNLGRTLQAVCYSTGANAFSAVPCLGWYVGWIWWAISAVIMVKTAQRVHGGRAALAVLAPPLVIVGAFVGLYIWFMVSMLPVSRALSTAAGQANSLITQTEADKVLQAVLRHARDDGGQGPRHAAELVTAGELSASDFVGSGSGTRVETAHIDAATTLAQLSSMSDEQARAVVAAAAAALPEGTVAHRVGDFVFIYQGADLSAVDSKFWVLIASP